MAEMTTAEFNAALREAGFGVDRGHIVDVSGKCPGFMRSIGDVGNVPADFLLDGCNRWRFRSAINMDWFDDDLLDEGNDRPTHLRLADTTERQGQRDTVRSGEKIVDVRG
jgi:hypothetical protein